MRGSGPSLPRPKSPLFPQNKFLTLSRSRDDLAKPISRCFSLAKPISKFPGLALWNTFSNMFHYFLAATPFPAVLLLARTLGIINPVRRAWIYGH